jgi:hypothetical protein
MLITNRFLKHVIEGKIGRLEVTGRRGLRRDDFTVSRKYWKLKEAKITCTLRRTCFGKGRLEYEETQLCSHMY